MLVDFNSVIALMCGALISGLILVYILAFQPSSRVLPRRMRECVQAYYTRFVFLCTHVLMNRAFRIHLLGDTLDPKETALIICNHQTVLDLFLLNTLAKRLSAHSECFFFIHRQIVRLPTMHTIIERQRGHLNWSVPPSSLDKIFDVVHSASKSHPRWIVVFPEGERYTASRSNTHQIMCQMAGTEPLKHVLYPRYPATIQAIEYLRTSTITAVYDLTIEYGHISAPSRRLVPSLHAAVTSNHEWEVRVLAQRYGISRIKRTPEQLEKWLERLWFSKDKYLDKSAKKAARLPAMARQAP